MWLINETIDNKSVIENLVFSDIPNLSKKYLKEINIENAKNWLNQVILEPIIFEYIGIELALTMYKGFLEKIEKKYRS